MPDTAIRKILVAAKSVIDAGVSGATIDLDRLPQEAFTEDDLPAITLEAGTQEPDILEWNGGWHWKTALQIGVVTANTLAGNFDENCRAIMGQAIQSLFADPTIDGRVEDITLQMVAPAFDEGVDNGALIADLTVTYHTPTGDMFTLVGHGGTRF